MNIALLIRKSPTDKKEIDKSIEKQIDIISKRVYNDFPDNKLCIDIYQDVAKGDDDKARIQLYNFFSKINKYEYAYCLNIDRFSRSYLGLKYLYEYIMPSNCKLKFVEDLNLYNSDGSINEDQVFMFGIQCLVAQKELINIRRRTKEGRKRAAASGKKLSKLNIVEKNPQIKKDVFKLKANGLNNTQIAKELNISRTMTINILNKY